MTWAWLRLERRGAFLLGLVCCLAPLLWGPMGRLFYTADYNLPLDPGRAVASLLAGWSTDNLGAPTVRFNPHLFPFLAFWRIGQVLGVPLWIIQRLWLAGLLALAYVSATAFVRFLVPGARRSTSAAVAITYVFNPFTLYSFAVGHNIAFLAYAAAPLWLATLLRAVRSDGGPRQRMMAAAVTLLFASSFDNPAVILSFVLVPTALFLIRELLARRDERRQIAVSTARIVAWVGALHSWWIIPTLWAVLKGSSYRYAGSAGSLLEWPGLATRVDFVEFLRGHGFWGQYAGYRGVPYLSWAPSFEHPLLVASSWLLASLAVSALLVHRRPAGWIKIGALLFVVSIFLSKGINPPAGGLNKWLYLNVPGFHVFRGTYEKFGGMAFLGVLLGAAALLVAPRWSARARLSLIVVVAGASAASAWPLVTGDVAQPMNANGVSSTVRVPSDYQSLRVWTASVPSSGSLLIVPWSPSGYVKTDWGFAGPDPLHNFSRLPVFAGEPEASRRDGSRYSSLLDLLETPEDAALAQRLGVAYVVVRHDVDHGFYAGTPTPEAVEGRLRGAGYVVEAVLGKLSVWRLPVPTAPFWLQPARGAPVLRPEPSKRVPSASPRPSIPTNARFVGAATVKGTARISGPTWLYLPQVFSAGWRLSVTAEKGASAKVVKHAAPADFGNAWLVDGQGNVSFRIRHDKGLAGVAGLTITAAGFLTALVALKRDRGRVALGGRKRRLRTESVCDLRSREPTEEVETVREVVEHQGGREQSGGRPGTPVGGRAQGEPSGQEDGGGATR